MKEKYFVPIQLEDLEIKKGTVINKRPAWLYVKKRFGIKIIQIDDTFYTHRFKSYFVPNNASKDELKAFFDFIAPIYDEICKSNIAFGNHFLEQIKSFPKSVDILDIMAGTGLPNTILYNAGYETQLLLDISKGMLEQAKNKMPKIKTHTCSFEHFKPRDKFDIIISAVGLHYMSLTWEQFNAKICSWLKPNGQLIIIESNPVPVLKKLKLVNSSVFEWNNGRKMVNLYSVIYQNASV